MSQRIKVFIQYFILLGITVLLVWFSLRGLKPTSPDGTPVDTWSYLANAWDLADKKWLLAMAAVAMVSHLVRAERWRMLMQPSGNPSKLNYAFYSLMVGYLVNLVIPRGGELSRCYNLYKLDKTPVEISFGTVVTERIIDVIFLLTLIGFSFIIESKKLLGFIETLPIGAGSGGGMTKYILILVLVVAILIIAFFLLRRNKKVRDFFSKTFTGFREGLLSVFRLKNPKLFIFYSVLIWALYFLMSYTVIMAFPSTSTLGLSAVLSLFAIGAIAMAAPLPGGTGSYHVLVPQGLIFLYAVPKADAVAFTFIFHGWQTLIMIAGGAISLVLTSALIRKKNRKT